jgi:hypothetical protein
MEEKQCPTPKYDPSKAKSHIDRRSLSEVTGSVMRDLSRAADALEAKVQEDATGESAEEEPGDTKP